MARRYITDLVAGETVESQVFLVSSKDLRTTTNGSLYIHAVLKDKTGEIPARMWQASEVLYANLPEGGFIDLKGRVESYKGSLQFIIDALRPVQTADVNLGDFLPASAQDVERMWADTLKILRTVRNKHLQALLKSFVEDADFVTAFKRAPAAATIHHAHIGGLCEHTLNVMEIARLVLPRYPQVSSDLVLTGVFLHDAGKTAELKCDTSFAYTEPGQLLGHITLVTLWIEEKCRLVSAQLKEPFPDNLKWALQHIILSHHGQYEFGSPKLPATPEAVMVHYVDNLDAKVYAYLHQIATDRDAESPWTNYNHALGTKVWKEDVLGVRSSPPPAR